MKTIMKKTLLSLCVLTLSSVTQAQNNIVYTYDANGNRTSRTFTKPKPISSKKISENAKIENNVIEINIPQHVKPSDCVIMLSDIMGNMLEMKQATAYTETLDFEKLRPGVYIVSIVINNEITSRKFIK